MERRTTFSSEQSCLARISVTLADLSWEWRELRSRRQSVYRCRKARSSADFSTCLCRRSTVERRVHPVDSSMMSCACEEHRWIAADTSMIDIRCAMSRHCWCSALNRLLRRFPDQYRAGSVDLRRESTCILLMDEPVYLGRSRFDCHRMDGR